VVWYVNSDHSIIVEYCKEKQTYLHFLSLKNQILRHVHSTAYNNIYYLSFNGKEIAITSNGQMEDFKQKTLTKFMGE
jgi:hypothetical protein